VYQWLHNASPSGIIYQRQDEDVLTLSPTRLADGRRRRLNERYRIQMFRGATRLVFLHMSDTIHVMAVQWRRKPQHAAVTPE
jgi:hypothetical protein